MTNQDSEQITLHSSEFDQLEEDITPTTITGELSQSVNIKEQIKLFRIFDKKHLNVNEKTAKGTISFFVNLTILDAKPAHKRIIKFAPLFWGVFFISLAWFAYYLKNIGLPILTSPYVYTAIILFAAIGLILIVYVVKATRNVLIFYSEHGRIPLVELFYRVPNKATFLHFVSELSDCINANKSKSYYTDSQTLAAELSEHRKLRDKGILSNKDYETAKNNIFSSH